MVTMKQTLDLRTCVAVATGIVLALTPLAAKATSILGSASSFAVLGPGIVNTGPSVAHGDLGASSGAGITGLGQVMVDGGVHQGDATAIQAQSDTLEAFIALGALKAGTDLSGRDLGVVGVLAPGAYRFASSAQLTGALNLDFTRHANEAFVFQIGSTLTTATAAKINVIGGGPHSRIYWKVGSSATLGDGTLFAGNLLADQSITFDPGADMLFGRAIALNGAVTLNAGIVSMSAAGGSYGTGRTDFGSRGFDGAVPEPSTWGLMLVGLAAMGGALRRRRSGYTQAPIRSDVQTVPSVCILLGRRALPS